MAREVCLWCNETIDNLDYEIVPHLTGQSFEPRYWHTECLTRSIIGGLNHLKGTCTCCGGTDPPDPPELSRRQAAIAAINCWNR